MTSVNPMEVKMLSVFFLFMLMIFLPTRFDRGQSKEWELGVNIPRVVGIYEIKIASQ